jgi:hypothetical protein
LPDAECPDSGADAVLVNPSGSAGATAQAPQPMSTGWFVVDMSAGTITKIG